jgi:calcineurin-like phosphoesterase family protein
MIWITSDTHFGHKNIAGKNISNWKSGYRDFDSLDEMNKCLVVTINKYVKWDDELWHIGDWSFGGENNVKRFRDQLNVQNIHIIKGNHDQHIDKNRELFSSIQTYWEGQLGHAKFVLFPYGKSMDVGIDSAYKLFGEYKPFSINEIMDILDKRETKVVDHHKSEI